ncbi:MAG TPA: hypothetical protein PLW78_13480, partial [bacterium]|nr:hypothetical protein [bacterium]
TTGHENIVIDGIEDEFLDDKQMNIFDALPERDLDSLISRLPENMRTESNINLLKQYSGSGVEYIVSAIEYTKKHCKENFDAYLAKCLADDWAKGEREKQVVEERKKNEQIRKEADKTAKQKKTAEKFYSSMSGDDLEKIHREAEASMYYKFTFMDKVQQGEIKKADALKEVSLVLISGKIDKGEL